MSAEDEIHRGMRAGVPRGQALVGQPAPARPMIWWDGLAGADRHMADFHRFVRDLLTVRRRHPALRSRRRRVPAGRPGAGAGLAAVGPRRRPRHGRRGQPRREDVPRRLRPRLSPAAACGTRSSTADHYDHYPNPWTAGNNGRDRRRHARDAPVLPVSPFRRTAPWSSRPTQATRRDCAQAADPVGFQNSAVDADLEF